MKITQLHPARPGLVAVFVDMDTDKGLTTETVELMGCVEFDDGDILIDAFTYVYGDGFVPVNAQPHFIGLTERGTDLSEFALAEEEYRKDHVGEKGQAN